MRCRTGRFVGYKNIEGAAYEVDLDIPWFFHQQEECTRFIRENCRRGNWSRVPWAFNDGSKACVRYLFVDQEDAMHFKMRFT